RSDAGRGEDPARSDAARGEDRDLPEAVRGDIEGPGDPAGQHHIARRVVPRVGLLVVAVVLVGLNLRAPVVGVPPLIPQIADDLGLTGSAAGLLTTIPLLCFAVVSPLVAPVVRRTWPDGALLLALGLLAVATAVRPWGGA